MLELLATILPLIEDVYGSHWKDIINFMFTIIQPNDIIPCMTIGLEGYVNVEIEQIGVNSN